MKNIIINIRNFKEKKNKKYKKGFSIIQEVVR